jgi:monoamine oxidase
MNINRRKLLTSTAAILGYLTFPRYAFSSNPDVIVIGAGAAGLSATSELLKNGYSVVCIEANNRIGGRAYTDNEIFGLPFDVGAHWIQNSQNNPFIKYGETVKDKGFDVYRPPTKWGEEQYLVYDGMNNVTGTSKENELWATYKKVESEISKAALLGLDVPVSDIISKTDSKWFESVHHMLGAWDMAKDFQDISCVDWYNYPEESLSWFCKQGYGALLTHRWKDLPVKLNTKAHKIKWGGPHVEVETNNGTITAKQCIITVSTGILSSDQLEFLPKLSNDKYESFNKISMGVYNHVAILFQKNFFKEIGLSEMDTYIYYKIKGHNPSPKGMGCLMNISGSNLCYFDTGGDFAIELENSGPEAQIDFTINELKSLFGSKIEKYFIKAHSTQWGKNIFTLGSYACAEPGSAHLRKIIKKQINDCLFFAGEATANEYASVSGAHRSGIRAANEVMNKKYD